MTRPLLDNEPSFFENADGLLVKYEQAITSDFVDSLKEERAAKANKRSGEFERFASVPTSIVEVWTRQGRDWQHASPKEIIKWLKADGLDHFICGKAYASAHQESALKDNTMKADFQAILNRDDCSDAQADVFMRQGMQRIQRDCRLPSMERQQAITVGSSGTDMVLVPADLVALQDIIWTPGPAALISRPRALAKTSYRDLLKMQQSSFPSHYARVQGQYWIAGKAAQGDTLQILFWGNFSNFPTGDSDNELSASTPDFAVYAALSFAADNFEHPLAAQWESRYQAIKAEVQMMADSLEAEGGPQSVQSVYRWE